MRTRMKHNIFNSRSILYSLVVAAEIVNSKEFSDNDVRQYPDFQDRPFPGAFKCFTCDEKDNYDCNTSAPDFWCPRGTFHCKSIHTFQVDLLTGQYQDSLRVEKVCASRRECHESDKCIYNPITGKKQCTECCTGNICNMAIPYTARDLVIETTTTPPPTTTTVTTTTTKVETSTLNADFENSDIEVPELTRNVHPIVTRRAGSKLRRKNNNADRTKTDGSTAELDSQNSRDLQESSALQSISSKSSFNAVILAVSSFICLIVFQL